MFEVGEEEGLIIAVPDGIPDAESGTRTWNITEEYSEAYGWRWVHATKVEYSNFNQEFVDTLNTLIINPVSGRAI